MVSAWYMSDVGAGIDQGKENRLDPDQPVSVDDLKAKSGVEVIQLDKNDFAEGMDKIKSERGYDYEDCIEVDSSSNADTLKRFFTEHIHADEEVRFVEGGCGYFDVRDAGDRWIRVRCEPGDLIVLPAGIYHRFTLDTNNFVMVRRLFKGAPVWTPYNRPDADDMRERKEYVKWAKGGFNESSRLEYNIIKPTTYGKHSAYIFSFLQLSATSVYCAGGKSNIRQAASPLVRVLLFPY